MSNYGDLDRWIAQLMEVSRSVTRSPSVPSPPPADWPHLLLPRRVGAHRRTLVSQRKHLDEGSVQKLTTMARPSVH